jgi:hypothetical protein
MTRKGGTISTNLFRIKYDEYGKIEVFDKDGNLILKGNKLEIENEAGSVYTHRDLTKTVESMMRIVAEEGRITTANQGLFKSEKCEVEERDMFFEISIVEDYYPTFWPYRNVEVERVRFFRNKLMEIEKRITVYKNLPLIGFKTRVKNKFPFIRLRVKFEPLSRVDGYEAEVPFGVIRRAEKEIEAPVQRWVDFTSKGWGITLINKGIPGHTFEGNRLYLTLIRSVGLLSHGDKGSVVPVTDALELREYEFEYALYFHPRDWKEDEVWKVAYGFSRPPIVFFRDSEGKGDLPQEFSFISFPSNLILSAFKMSEDREKVVLRFWETAGKETEFKPNLFGKMVKANRSNVLEEKFEEVDRLEVKPFKIVTLIYSPKFLH